MVFAQANSDAPILRAYALEQQDQPANAVALVRPLVDSGTLRGAELGRAWTVLGIAYQDQNDLDRMFVPGDLCRCVVRDLRELGLGREDCSQIVATQFRSCFHLIFGLIEIFPAFFYVVLPQGKDRKSQGSSARLRTSNIHSSADANRFEDALGEMRQGLTVLDRAWGRKDPRYLDAEIAYSEVLYLSGDHRLATSLRATDEATAKEIKRNQCIRCTISAEALR